MIDTLMALWNQGHLKKVAKMLFTVVLITLSTALLAVVAGGPFHTFLSHNATNVQAGKNPFTPTNSVSGREVSTQLVSDAIATQKTTTTVTTEIPTTVPRPLPCYLFKAPPFVSVTRGPANVVSLGPKATHPVHHPSPTPATKAVVPTTTAIPTSTPVFTPVVIPTDVPLTPTPTAPPIFDTPEPSTTPTEAPTETPVDPTPPLMPFPQTTPGIPGATFGISNALTVVAQTPTVILHTATPTLSPTPTTPLTPSPAPRPFIRIGEGLADSAQNHGVSYQICITLP